MSIKKKKQQDLYKLCDILFYFMEVIMNNLLDILIYRKILIMLIIS